MGMQITFKTFTAVLMYCFNSRCCCTYWQSTV